MTAEQWHKKAREVCEHSFLRGGPPIIEAVAEALAAAYAEGVRASAAIAEDGYGYGDVEIAAAIRGQP